MFKISDEALRCIEGKEGNATVFMKLLTTAPGCCTPGKVASRVPAVRTGKPFKKESELYEKSEIGDIAIWKHLDIMPANP